MPSQTHKISQNDYPFGDLKLQHGLVDLGHNLAPMPVSSVRQRNGRAFLIVGDVAIRTPIVAWNLLMQDTKSRRRRNGRALILGLVLVWSGFCLVLSALGIALGRTTAGSLFAMPLGLIFLMIVFPLALAGLVFFGGRRIDTAERRLEPDQPEGN